MSACALLFSLLMAPTARAGVLSDAVHSVLDAESGWTLVETEDGIAVYRKPVSSLGLTAWKGIKTLAADVSPAAVQAVITDLDNREQRHTNLQESTVVSRSGPLTTYYQVFDSPAPVADRYWICRSLYSQDPAAGAGHWKMAWSSAPADALSELREGLSSRLPNAVEARHIHGSWELRPQSDGSTSLIYISMADPGGSLPGGLMSSLTGRNLPELIATIEDEARQH